jgi:nucleoside-diphosphate-sugar epimerase
LTDVFDGQKISPYTEEDATKPISVYGESKLAGEKNVLATENRHLVVRVSSVFGPDIPSFIDGIINRAQENREVDPAMSILIWRHIGRTFLCGSIVPANTVSERGTEDWNGVTNLHVSADA